MKVRLALVAALILVLVGVVGLSEQRTYNEIIGDAESVVISGSLNFYSSSTPSINNPTYEGVVMCDEVLVIEVYFNHAVTLTLNATAFIGDKKTLPTEYGVVGSGLAGCDPLSPRWFGPGNVDLCEWIEGTNFSDWTGPLTWVTTPITNYAWNLVRDGGYPDGKKYINAKVRVTRDGYADPAGTYTATITVTVN